MRKKLFLCLILMMTVGAIGLVNLTSVLATEISNSNSQFFSDNAEITITENKEYGGNTGLGVNVKANKGDSVVLNYNNWISPNNLDDFIKLQVIPSSQSTIDFSNMFIILEDAMDSSQQVVVTVDTFRRSGSYSTTARLAFTDDLICSVNSTILNESNQKVMGYDRLITTGYNANGNILRMRDTRLDFFNAGANPTGANYAGVFLPFNIPQVSEVNRSNSTLPVTFSFTDNVVSIKENQLGYIADISDPLFLNASKADLRADHKYYSRYSNGYVKNLFSSGQVKLKIKLVNLTTGEANLNILSIKDQQFESGQFDLVRNDAPALQVEKFTLNAIKGFPYTLPKSKAITLNNKTITVDTAIYFDNILTDSSVQTFTPQNVGTYNISYFAENEGRITERFYEINVFAAFPNVQFDVDGFIPDEYGVGKKITIPGCTAISEISRLADKSISVKTLIQKDNRVIIEKDNADAFDFTIQSEGVYEIVYITNTQLLCVSVKKINFNAVNKPIINVQNFTKPFYMGQQVILQSDVGFYDGEKRNTIITVLDPLGNAVVLTNNSFTPSLSGTYEIEYTLNIAETTVKENSFFEVSIKPDTLFENVNSITRIEDNFGLPEWTTGGNGILLSSNTQGATARLNNVIDFNSFNDTVQLLKFQFLHGGGFGQVKRFEVTLTDADNQSNSITIVYIAHADRALYSYIHVNYKGMTLARNTETGGQITSSPLFGCLTSISMYGNSLREVPEFSLKFNYNEKAFYINTNATTENYLLLDLDDVNHVGPGNDWKGFTFGRAFLTVSLKSFTDTAGVVLTEVAGQSISGLNINDETAPRLYLDMLEEYYNRMPDAIVGRDYRIPRPSAYDLLNKNCVVDMRLFFDGNDISSQISSGTFTPQHEGQYSLEYVVYDNYANRKSQTLIINAIAASALDDMELVFTDIGQTENIFAGSYFTIPDIKILNSSGVPVINSMTVMLNGNTLYADGLNRYFLSESGELAITISAKDYLERSINDTLTIDINIPNNPIITVSGVPHAAITNEHLSIPDFTALKYDGSNNVADREIYIDGIKIYSNIQGVIWGSLSYLVNAPAKSVLELEYRSEGSSKKFYIPVINKDNITDFIVSYNPDAEESKDKYNDDGITKNTFNTYSKIITDRDKGFKLPYPIAADDMTLLFSVDKNHNRFSSISIVLTDYYNPEIQVILTIKNSPNGPLMSINNKGVEYNIAGSFSDGSNFHLIYSERQKAILSGDGRYVYRILDCANSLEFNGFDSKAVYLLMELKGVAGGNASLELRQIGNQTFTSFGDNAGPSIILNANINIGTVGIGETIKLPAAQAFDLLSGYASVSVSVNYGKNYIINKKDANIEHEFIAQNYGIYRVLYETVDKKGNPGSLSFIVNVKDDIPPEIKLEKSFEEQILLGKSIYIPDATVSDNVSDLCDLFVFVKLPSGAIKSLSVKSDFTPSVKGEYMITYYAYDEYYNVQIIENRVTVE